MESMELRELLEKANLIYYLGGSPSPIFHQMESDMAIVGKAMKAISPDQR